MFEVIEHMFNL